MRLDKAFTHKGESRGAEGGGGATKAEEEGSDDAKVLSTTGVSMDNPSCCCSKDTLIKPNVPSVNLSLHKCE